MATELEKFLVEKLKEIPKEHPDRKFLDDELIRVRLHLVGITGPEEILTEEFATRVNRVAGIIPDDVPVNKLHYSIDKAYGYVIDHELSDWQFSWRTFRHSLKGREQRELTAIINTFIRYSTWGRKLDEEGNIMTLGELREVPLEVLSDLEQYKGIGSRRAAFIKIAFMRQDPSSAG